MRVKSLTNKILSIFLAAALFFQYEAKASEEVHAEEKKFDISSKKRTYQEIIEGLEAESYPLFFRITKHQNNKNTKEMQTFIIPSTNSNLIKFFDTPLVHTNTLLKPFLFSSSLHD